MRASAAAIAKLPFFTCIKALDRLICVRNQALNPQLHRISCYVRFRTYVV